MQPLMRFSVGVAKALLRALVGIAAFVVAKFIVIALVAVLSVSMSIASFAVPQLANVMSRMAAAVIGPPVVASLAETRHLRQQNQTLQRRNQSLDQRNRNLGQQNRTLRTQNRNLTASNTRLAGQNRSLSGSNRRLQGQIAANRRVVKSATTRIGRRAVRTATRSMAAIPIESIPILGVATIIATTAWEMRDACSTLDDMAEIQRQMGEEPEATWHARACNFASVGNARAGHYGAMTITQCRSAASDARAQWIDLAKTLIDETSDIMESGEGLDVELMAAADEEYAQINAVCDCLEDMLCDPRGLFSD